MSQLGLPTQIFPYNLPNTFCQSRGNLYALSSLQSLCMNLRALSGNTSSDYSCVFAIIEFNFILININTYSWRFEYSFLQMTPPFDAWTIS